MFVEPTLLDIEKAWESDRVHFHQQEWKTSGLTAAEWAWLKYPSFWELGAKPVPARPDGTSWWNWTISKLEGNNMQKQIHVLLNRQVEKEPSTLTVLLSATSKMKLGLSKSEQSSTIKYLATEQSLTWTGPHGENPWDSGLATRDTVLFETLIKYSTDLGLHPDLIVYPKTGNTLMHQAVLHDWEGGIRTLINNNVAVDVKNKDNLNPKELAREMNLKAALRGFSQKTDVNMLKPKTERAKPQSTQMDLF